MQLTTTRWQHGSHQTQVLSFRGSSVQHLPCCHLVVISVIKTAESCRNITNKKGKIDFKKQVKNSFSVIYVLDGESLYSWTCFTIIISLLFLQLNLPSWAVISITHLFKSTSFANMIIKMHPEILLDRNSSLYDMLFMCVYIRGCVRI